MSSTPAVDSDLCLPIALSLPGRAWDELLAQESLAGPPGPPSLTGHCQLGLWNQVLA